MNKRVSRLRASNIMLLIAVLLLALFAIVGLFGPRRTALYLSSHDLSLKGESWIEMPVTSTRLLVDVSYHTTPHSTYLRNHGIVYGHNDEQKWLFVYQGSTDEGYRSGAGEWAEVYAQLNTRWKRERFLQWSNDNPEHASVFWRDLLDQLQAENESAAFDLIMSQVAGWSKAE